MLTQRERLNRFEIHGPYEDVKQFFASLDGNAEYYIEESIHPAANQLWVRDGALWWQTPDGELEKVYDFARINPDLAGGHR